MDLNHRPRLYQASAVRFYKNLQQRGDCQAPRKPHKTSYAVGWIVGYSEDLSPIHLTSTKVASLKSSQKQFNSLIPG